MLSKSKIKNYINKQSFYPTTSGILFNPFYIARKNLLINISKLAKHFNGGYLLDIGCGIKPYEPLFNVDSYIGLDVRGGGHSDNAKHADVYYDGNEFPFKSYFFDYAISNEVLEHVFEPEHLIMEIHRILKPNGLLLLTVPFVWDEHEIPHDYGRYTSFGLNYLLSKNGFEIIKQHKSGSYVDTLAQLFSSYIYTVLLTKNPYVNVLTSLFLCSPILMIGLFLSKILPENNNLYLDNIILARKI